MTKVVARVRYADGYRTPAHLESLRVKQKFGNHTSVWLGYQFSDRVKYRMPNDGTPFQIQWGSIRRGSTTTFGYVNHYDSDHSAERTDSNIVALGTSLRMNRNVPSTWSDVTYSYIAKDIARRNGFTAVVHPHPVVLRTWSTGTRTDFTALKELAYEAGYEVWVDGSTMYFLDPYRSIKSLRQTKNGGYPTFTRAQILQSKVMGGFNAPRDERVAAIARVNVHGLDYRTNEFFTASSGTRDFPERERTLGVAANDYTQARTQANAASKGRGHDTVYSLHATVRGDANVYPGGVIRVAGHEVADDQQGLWVVTSADHRMNIKTLKNTHQNDFTTELVAIRNTKFAPTHLRESTMNGAVFQPGCVVRNGLWEAEVRDVVHV